MNFKSIIMIGAIILLSPGLWAQYTVSGTIADTKTGEPLPGAVVFISELKTGVATDANGFFELSNLKEGNYLLEISLLGYKTFIKRISLLENINIRISLVEAVTELNEVIITGVTRSTEIKKSPVIIKSISSNHLLQNSSTNLIDGLKSVPGISQITTGSSISKPVIRGLGYNRIITLNNGIRQEGQQWGDEHGIEIDEFGVGRVEIIKGPGSLMYGSDGIAGVINFLAPKLPLEGNSELRFLSNYQSNNNLVANSLSYSGNKEGIQWLGRISNKWAGSFKNAYDDRVFNSGSKEINGSLFLGINKKWGYSNLTFSSFNNQLGMVEGERDNNGEFLYINKDGVERTVPSKQGYSLEVPNQKINHHALAWNSYYKSTQGALITDLGFQNNRRREFDEPTDPDEAELYLTLNTFTYNLRYNFDKVKGWENTIGVGGMYQQNNNLGDEFLIPDYKLWDAGIFVFTQKTFEKITFAAGLRADDRILKSKELHLDGSGHPVPVPDESSELRFKSLSRNLNGISGSIGISYPVSTVSTVKFNVSRGYRAPNIAELTSNGVHEGTFRYELGNEELLPEISHQIDLAYYLTLEHVTFEISPFVNFINNYIYLQKMKDEQGNDIYPDPDENVAAYRFTSDNSLLYGSEIYFDIHPHPLDRLHFENTFSFVRGVQREIKQNLPFMPAPKYRGELRLDINTRTSFLSETYFKASVDHYFKQSKIFNAFDTETATPAYTLLGLGIGIQIKGKINLIMNVDNLSNVAYQSHLSRLKYAPENPLTGRTGIYNMGRNVSIKAIIRV